jgi:hypothetical protein
MLFGAAAQAVAPGREAMRRLGKIADGLAELVRDVRWENGQVQCLTNSNALTTRMDSPCWRSLVE